MRIAITREISDAIADCELTHLSREPIDLNRARAQHEAYEAALRDAGCRVERLAAGSDMPDAVFVEDAAVVLDGIAIVTRPGALSRRGETPAVADALGRYREVRRIEAPGTLDGGDVLVVGRSIFVGRSCRTNDDGIDQMRRLAAEGGYDVRAVEVHGCLHLKSAVTALGDRLLLVNPRWLARDAFAEFDRMEIDPREPMAANALRIPAASVSDRVIYPVSFPRTRGRLETSGVTLVPVDVSELQKAEGAVTCCSLIFEV